MHLFLTGEKRIGKSTLLNAILEAFPGNPGGFRTVRLNFFLPGEYTVHLLPANGSQTPTEENLLFHCGHRTEDTAARFARLGCQALEEGADAPLLLMDELGPHEAEAEAFQEAVRTALEGEVPILGVLQKADSPFLEGIARHPRVVLLEVTAENREELTQRIPEFINILRKR